MDNKNNVIMKELLTALVVTIAILFVYVAFDIIDTLERRTYPQTPASVYSGAVIPEGGNAKMSYEPDPVTDRGPINPAEFNFNYANGQFDINDVDKD